ncbi:MAG TPA: hybrid sensor histidine kinase/response regulator [Cyanobacteria bacterium UBA11049]|nr:hybrid sensor histidine kinase/response regulator [Cyanobacteria bacterium UBA11049]
MNSAPKANILLVDDHPENLIALEAILDRLDQNLVKANSGQEALRCLLHQDFAAILLDVQMPGMDGFETATLIRQRERSRNTPIIFLTAFSTSDPFVFKGYEIGAVDYLLKPLDAGILTSKVSVFVELFKKTMEVQRQAAELVAINAKLKQSEERFRSLSACAPLGIFSLDTSGRCTYTNPNCEAICGFTIGESWETAWGRCIHAEDRDRVANWSSCTQNDQTYTDEFRIYSPDGGLRWVQVSTSTMLSPQRQLLGHVGTIEDITERKLAEVVREQMIREQAARAEAEAANRMKDEFLAIVSHELRTPLNSILGWSQLLLTKKFDRASTLRALQTIGRNARSQAQLIEDLLDISKIIRGKLRLCKQPVNAIELIKIVLETVRPQAEAKAIELETLLDENAQMVCGDPERLQQIIWNLLSNAIKFTPNEGKVEIRLSVEGSMQEVRGKRLDSTLVSESALLTDSSSSSLVPQASGPGSFACIQVIDSGIGIAPDFLPYVFDRFRQADSSSTRSYGGLGLGLTIVSHLVELHGGKIDACSEGEGKGSTFTVKIPLLERAGKDRKDKQEEELGDELSLSPSPSTHNQLHSSELTLPSSPPPQPFLDGVQVLVVEDNNDTRDLVKMILQQSGALVTDVASVAEAMEFLERSGCHLMVSDIGMPGEDGYQLIRKVQDFEQQRGRKIPAIALTAYTRAEERIKALTAGFQMHVCKPVEPNKLLTAVAQLVASLKTEQVRTQ